MKEKKNIPRDNGRKGKKHTEETKKKISQSMLGNLNAEKYDIDDATELFSTLLVMSQDVKYYNIKKMCKEIGVSKRTIEDLLKRFETLKPLYELIKDNVEINCFESANRDSLKVQLALIILKSKHGYSDKIETKTDITSGGAALDLRNLITFNDNDEE